MKVAVVGLGNNGGTKVDQLRDCELVDQIVLCDNDPERVAATLAKGGSSPGMTAAASFADVLADADVRLVLISTPNGTHPELAIAALEAGKAVLCEKPMANSVAEARAMVDAAERTGGFLHIGFELRQSTLYTTVKEWIDAGLLGRVVNTQCTYVSSEYWGRGSWRVRPESGGMFGEKLSHYVDLPRWWIGGEVVDVYSRSAPNIVPYFDVRDNYHTTYRFADGAVSELTFMMGPAAHTEVDPLQETKTQRWGDGHELRYIVTGAKGAVQTEIYSRTLKRWEFTEGERGMVARVAEQRTWTQAEDHQYFHNTRDETLDVVRRVADGRPPSIDPADAFATTVLCFAAERSTDTGAIVTLSDIAAEAAGA